MIDLTVKTLDSQNHSFSLEDDITVRGFKEQIAESVAVPAESQRLIYCGRVLQDEKKLIEYDVNGKVIHLVHRAPPQSGQRGNSSGQGQDQGQGQGQNQDQGQSRNSHRPHFRHARAQVRLPRIDGNAMYLGAMAPPADGEGQGNPRPLLCSRQTYMRLVAASSMLNDANRSLHLLDSPAGTNTNDNNSASPSSQEQTQEPDHEQGSHEQQQDQEQEHDQEHDQDQDDASFEIGGDAGGGGLAQAASAAINAALSAAGLNNVAALSTAALSSLTLLGGQSDGGNPSIIHAHIQRNNIGGAESAAPTNPDDIGQSEQPQTAEQQRPVPPEHQGEEDSEQQQQQQPQDAPANANGQSNARSRPVSPSQHLQPLTRCIGQLMQTHDRLRPYLERYRSIITSERVWPTGGGPGSVEEMQRIFDGVSESLHHLSHATHALSDIVIDMSQQPPRSLRCRANIIQHSALLQAGIPIQVEAHISLHGRNQNVNNNNESGNATAPAAGAAPESGENSTPANEAAGATAPPQQSEPGNQQQQPTFGTLFNVPHNVEVLMEVGPEIGGNEQTQQNFSNRNNNNNGNPDGISAGIFPWGASPPPDFMRSLMQMVAGQMARGVATATTPNATTSATGEQQQATNSDGTNTVPAANVEGSNSNPGQSTQARGNTGTHPTTSTQTRSTPRPHVFHSNTHPFGVGLGQRYSYDPFLPCNSHHSRQTPAARATPNATASTQQQQQQQQQQQPQPQQPSNSSTTTDQNQTANSATNLGSGAPTRETNTSGENSTSVPPPQAANNLPIVNLLTQILNGGGVQSGQIQTGLGGWMQLFTGGIPVVQGLMANGSNQAGGGMTLMDLLGNASGLGVSTNIGIIGPLRMDQNLHGEDLLFDLVVTVVQNITLEGWEALRTGHWQPLTGIRRPLREFFENLFGSTSLSGSEERVIDRLISELQPTLNQFLLEDTNARDGPETNVDIPATIERLLRRHFLNILRLLFHDDVDDTRFAQGLWASLKLLQMEARSVLQYSFRGRQLRMETIAQRIVTRLTEGVDPRIRQWIVNSCVSHVCAYLVRMTELPDNEVVPLLVLKTTPVPTPPTPLVQQCTPQQTQSESESMETDAVEERVEVEPLGAEEGATFPGHEAVPSDWVPIIARDGVRQRRQLQVQMQSQGMTGSGVGGFSDAYLGGMPSKRRKFIEQQKPRILLSPTPNHSSVSISMERLVRESVGRAGIEEVEGAAAAVATDVGVRRAFGQAIRGCLHQHPQRQTAPDFPDASRFPNATKYFAKNDNENSKK